MRLFVEGRTALFEHLHYFAAHHKDIVWFHVASLGEYEQAKPVIAKLKEKMPGHSVLLTFFSPSGYENVIKKPQANVDFISYLPLDTPVNAKKFIDLVNPNAVFFVKYDLWANLILEAKRQNIPLFLFSASFRPDQVYFKYYGGVFRKILKSFDHIFTQNQTSKDLLTTIGYPLSSLTGDTRFDNVHALSQSPKIFPEIKEWINDEKVMVVGSAWQEDMDLLLTLINSDAPYKYIIAPHDINIETIRLWQEAIKSNSSLYSTLISKEESKVLFIDNIGMLSSLFQYADLAYIGGAFGRGLHNILEPLAFRVPVIFGELKIKNKFPEAGISLQYGCGFQVKDSDELIEVVDQLLINERYDKASNAAGKMVMDNLGSAEKIMAQVMIHLNQ
ncbi:3-deoxy-D-manno-octulosonic acid transferase [Anditalea andensis]|nr:glycosyltransferase N-terminal domain-containing protein [Anditalea andensis]